jgi:hypothetical protein
MVYFATSSECHTIRRGVVWLLVNNKVGMIWKEALVVQQKYYPSFCLERDCEKTRLTSVRIISASAEIGTDYMLSLIWILHSLFLPPRKRTAFLIQISVDYVSINKPSAITESVQRYSTRSRAEKLQKCNAALERSVLFWGPFEGSLFMELISAILPLLLGACYKVSINPIIQSRTRLISDEHAPTRDNMNKSHLTVQALTRRTYIGTYRQTAFRNPPLLIRGGVTCNSVKISV